MGTPAKVNLEAFVFNTEAHPLPIPAKPGAFARFQ